VYQGNPNQLKQKLDGSFASGTSSNPVLSLVYESWTDDFYKQGYIDPVQGHIDGHDGLSPEEQQDFVKAFLDGNTWDGKLVTLPFNKSIYLAHLNMDMLQAAGYTTAPAAQPELAEAIKKMTLRQGGRTATYGMGIIPKSEAFTTLLFARGGVLVSADDRPQFDSPEALASLQLLKSLQHPEKFLYVNTDYMSVPFGNKLIGMFIYSSASLPYNKSAAEGKFNYKAAPVPALDGVEARYLMQGTNIAIYANKPEGERQAAWKLVKFLTSPASAAFFVTKSGYMPYRYSMLEEPALKKHMAEDPNYAMAAQLVLTDKGKQEPKMRQWEGVRQDIDSMVDQLFSHTNSDPAALLAELQKKAEAKLK
jgi:ABC-type glycerol-3-phosphate transport system substrate-binding protein